MSRLATLISQHKRIALIAHIHPDGDAVGSLIALDLALKQKGIESTAVLVDPIPHIFQFLVGVEHVRAKLPAFEEVDLVLLLDLSDLARTGQAEQLKAFGKAGKLSFVDHHPYGDAKRYCQEYIHNLEASSTAELVYQLIIDLGVKITPDIATALLTGIYTDTGGFQHPNTSNYTLEVAAELMRRGGRLHTIARHISLSKSLASLKLLGIALERLRITCQGQCSVSVITYTDIEEAGALPEDLTGIIGNMNVLPEIKMCLLLTEITPGKLRGALRTGEGFKTDMHLLAKLLGGGGHPRASGFSLNGTVVLKTNGSWEIVALPEENR